MQDKAKGARPRARSDHEHNMHEQGIVLMNVLDHRLGITREQLLRELTRGSEDPTEEERFAVAVRDLASVGLLGFSGAEVVPTRAALRFSEITEALA